MTSTQTRVALTGGIASGKSLAGELLQAKGIPVIDADHIVHQLLKQDAELKKQIHQHFGPSVFYVGPAGEDEVDRSALAALVFADARERRQLESWIHPKVRLAINQFFEKHASAPLVVASIPLLFEAGMAHLYDEVWLISCDEATQSARLASHRAMTLDAAKARLASQMPLEEKKRRLLECPRYRILDNNGTPRDLSNQVNAALADFML